MAPRTQTILSGLIGQSWAGESILRLIWDARDNTPVSYDSIHASAKGRTFNLGAAVARERDRHGGGSHDVVTQVWLVTAASLSLPEIRRRGRSFAAYGRELDYDHMQDAEVACTQSACACERTRRHDQRGCQKGGRNFPGEAPAWLRSRRNGVLLSNSPSIDCSAPSSSWPMRSWCLIGCGFYAVPR
jgi:hypothetical protein